MSPTQVRPIPTLSICKKGPTFGTRKLDIGCTYFTKTQNLTRRLCHIINWRKHNSTFTISFSSDYRPKILYSITNIPYNITAPILRKFFAESKNKPETTILMVQKEVAEKISRTKAEKEKIIKGRSILSIAVEIFAEVENCFVVDRTMFSPAPRVDSAIIKLKSREKSLVPLELEKDFFTVVRAGFAEKRKKLGNHLGKFFGCNSGDLLGKIDGNKRAEVLEIAELIEIARNFQRISKDWQK